MPEPATPMRVEWDRLTSGVYEDMVACYLSTVHPSAVRTDGSGGDGGRDVHFDGPAGLEIFELKSFTGRVSGKRRAQVKRSYNQAMKLNPATWTLAVPIDPSPGEQAWFSNLTTASPARCSWLGKTGLDAAMADYPRIPGIS